jgi:hypothetical protein
MLAPVRSNIIAVNPGIQGPHQSRICSPLAAEQASPVSLNLGGLNAQNAFSCVPTHVVSRLSTTCSHAAIFGSSLTCGAANHHLVQCLGGGVTFALVHAPAQVGVKTELMVAHQHLVI